MTIETTINGGLAVLARGNVCDAEPDVGLMEKFVDGLEVTFLNGYPVPFELTDKDDQRVVNELVAAYNESPCDY